MFFANALELSKDQPYIVGLVLIVFGGFGTFLTGVGFLLKYIVDKVPTWIETVSKIISELMTRFEKTMDSMGKNFSVCMQDLKSRVDDIDNNLVEIKEDVCDVKDCQKKIVEKIDSFHRVENFSK